MRVQNGRTLTTDGPFVAVKEVLGGFIVYGANDLDAAIELAARIRRPGSAGPPRCARSWSTDSLLLEQVFRDEWGRVVTSLIGLLGRTKR